MRAVLKKLIAANRRNVIPGTREKARSRAPAGADVSAGGQKCGIVIAGPCQPGNGRSHPPSHSVTAIDETAIIAEYSARKNKDQRKPLYSVWNPAVNSDSASGKSNGARLVSATIAMAKIKNPTRPSGKNLKINHSP